jgi:hypothetical protein
MNKYSFQKLGFFITLLFPLFLLTSCVTFKPDITPLKIDAGEEPDTTSTVEYDVEYQTYIQEQAKKEAGDKGWFECEDHYQWRIKYQEARLDFILRGKTPVDNPSYSSCVLPPCLCKFFDKGTDTTEDHVGWNGCLYDGPQYPGKRAFLENNPEPNDTCFLGVSWSDNKPEYGACLP